ncbi:pyranose dehydrogenase [Podospora aff. communis PSN243]|uniref:Pyranose dehydrogenase n=1 Tax=Podospora aff. communis PSN243 TaxID=3040156 RepID=A0AAV9GW80_9PEZI|nr:pyranose dehydrogenase [Podospora aff. communis PSN243]
MVRTTLSLTLCGFAGIASAFGPAARSIVRSTLLERADQANSEYDYVIVGGGTAGLTVADKLTASGEHSVLVIELGVFQNGTYVTTAGTGYQGLFDPNHQQLFPSEPQTGLNGRIADVRVGKMLGGSSGMNALQVHRGQKADYDRWASYFPGNSGSGWNWNNMLPYFKEAWHFHPPNSDVAADNDIDYDPQYWGTTSDIHASWPTEMWPFQKVELAAIREMPGVGSPPDSGAGLPGAFWYPQSVDPSNMLRSFARFGHWDGIEAARSNYHTLTDHRVLKVNFNNKSASGVTFVPAAATSADNALTVTARKEVIMAAGAIHTPKILQASGIGAKALLESANIPRVVDLPGVGANFQDHPFQVGPSFLLTDFPFFPDPNLFFTNATFYAEAQAEFDAYRTGPLTIASGNAAAFLSMPVIAPTDFDTIAAAYEAQDPASYLPAGTDATVVRGYNAQKKALAKAMRSTGAAFYNFFVRGTASEPGPILLHPLSRGTVTINPSDPYFALPKVDYRAMTNPADGDLMVAFTKFTRRMFTTTSLTQFSPVETAPGANVTDPADIVAELRDRIVPTSFHPVGTAAMMPRNMGGVVDRDLKVYGVKKLSVIDASVMPDLPGAYTQQTVYAIACKAADLIQARA